MTILHVLNSDQEYDEYGQPTLTKSIADALKQPLDALKNPFGIFDKDEEHDHHYISSQYTPPSAYYPDSSGGYGAPQSGYGAPQTGYGAPQSGYGAPQSGYGAPQSGYGAPDTGYGAPKQPDHGFKPSYNPSNDYTAPSPGYVPPVSTGHSNESGQGHSSGHVTAHSGHHDHSNQYLPSSNGDTHVHHHYYHDNDQASNSNNNNYYGKNNNNIYNANNDIFKRETLPGTTDSMKVEGVSRVSVEGGSANGSAGGFKFPTSRRVDPQAIRSKRQPERQPHSIDVNDNSLLKIANQLKSQVLNLCQNVCLPDHILEKIVML